MIFTAPSMTITASTASSIIIPRRKTMADKDIEHFLSREQSELDNIVAGMIALMSDSEGKYEAMKNQNWFKRMALTVTGKNKAALEDIRKNNEQLNAYCAKALAAFVGHQRISEGIFLNLGAQISTLYASHNELKQILLGIVSKLNEKIKSVDDYHTLCGEIRLDKFGKSLTGVYCILSLLDGSMIDDSRKMDDLKALLTQENIITESISVKSHLLSVCDIEDKDVGAVYMEAMAHVDSVVAQMTVAVLENWNFVTLANRQLLKKQNVVDKILDSFDVDGETKLSLKLEFEQAIENKRIILNQTRMVINGLPHDKETEAKHRLQR